MTHIKTEKCATPTSHNSFSQGTSPGQSLLRNANHATQNDSSSQNTFHLSSTSHPPLNHFRQASLNGNPKPAGFHKPPNSAHVPLAASGVPEPSSAAFAWASRGWGWSQEGGVYCNPKWLESRSSCLPGRADQRPGVVQSPQDAAGPRALGQVALGRLASPAPRRSGRPPPTPPRSPPGYRAHTQRSHPALTPTRTLAWSGGYLRTPPTPCRDPPAAAVWPRGAARTPREQLHPHACRATQPGASWGGEEG